MDSTKIVSYDYANDSCACGFSKFPDGFKFKYNEDGEVCLSTDCSTWAKRLLNNLPLNDYIESESFVPPSEFLSFPEFGSQERKKNRKESVGNYIEDCDLCGEYMEKTFSFYGRLICKNCNHFLQSEKCLLCKNEQNKFSKRFLSTRVIHKKGSTDEYCSTCWRNLMQLANSYFNRIPNEGRVSSDDEDEFDDTCLGCGDNTGGICYWCRIEM